MIEEPYQVRLADGIADGVVFYPEGDGPFPTVVFYFDAGGLRPAMSEMAARLVAAGYAVVQPNLYWRSGPFAPFDFATVWGDPVERARIGALMAGVKGDVVAAETEAILDAIRDPRLDTEHLGLIGYCMGGRMAFVVASRLGRRVVAAAPIHAGGLVTDRRDSPHLAASDIRARLYLGVADHDNSCTPEHQETLRNALTLGGVDFQLELYPGCRHGFAVSDFPVYDAAAAEKHWDRVLALFGDTLAHR